MTDTIRGPQAGQLERIKEELLSRHRDEEISYASCNQNGCFDSCVLRLRTNKDGVVTAIETDDTINKGLGREDAYIDEEALRSAMVQKRACVRGRGLRKDCYADDRILYPMKRVGPKGSRQFERISWDEALDTIASKILETREKYGPKSVHHDGMLGSTFDPFASFLPGGGIACWGEDSFEPSNFADQVCFGKSFDLMGTFMDGHADAMTLLDSKAIILWGFDTCVNYPEMIWYFLMAKERGVPIIYIDPRFTWTAQTVATQYIPIRPGTDLACWEAMAYVMFSEDIYDHEFVEKWVEPVGLAKWRKYIMGDIPGELPKTPEWAEKICGIPAETITELARFYAANSPCYWRSVWNISRQVYGKDSARGANYLQALGGNFGKDGCSGANVGIGCNNGLPFTPFNTSGIENGPYQSEVCMEAEMWHNAITMRPDFEAGLITEEDYKMAIGCPLNAEAPNIHMLCLLHMNRNPVSGWYDMNKRIKALEMCDFVVYGHWHFSNPTVPYADILLPLAHSFLEGPYHQSSTPSAAYAGPAVSGYGTHSFTLSVSKAKAVGETRERQWIFKEIANRLGIGDQYAPTMKDVSAEDWNDAVVEKAREAYEFWKTVASGFGVEAPEWEDFVEKPVFRIPLPETGYHVFMKDNLLNDKPLDTPSGKIEFYSEFIADNDLATAQLPHMGKALGRGQIKAMAMYRKPPEGMHDKRVNDYPLYMVTPHSFFKNHTAYDANPWFRDESRPSVWISATDAKARNIKDGDKVRVFNDVGEIHLPAYVTSRLMPGVTCMIFGRYYEPNGVKTNLMPTGIDTRGNCNALISSEFYDDVLGVLRCNALVEIQNLEPILNLENLKEA